MYRVIILEDAIRLNQSSAAENNQETGGDNKKVSNRASRLQIFKRTLQSLSANHSHHLLAALGAGQRTSGSWKFWCPNCGVAENKVGPPKRVVQLDGHHLWKAFSPSYGCARLFITLEATVISVDARTAQPTHPPLLSSSFQLPVTRELSYSRPILDPASAHECMSSHALHQSHRSNPLLSRFA